MGEPEADVLSEAVRYHGSKCQLQISDEHFLTCSPAAGGEFRTPGLLSCKNASASLELCKDAVIGAQHDGKLKIRIHYAKVWGGAAKVKRSLHHTKWMVCHSPQSAKNSVKKIREWAVWQRDPATPNKLLVIMNPTSGTGKAVRVFERTVRSILEDACGYDLQCVCTQRHGHAVDVISKADLQSISAILFFGGDGTVHEGIQGLFSRSDWSSVANIPIVQFPLGSGNGLAASTGLWNTPTALHAVCKGNIKSMDLLSVVQGSRRWFSFLGVMYGAITSLDIGTERLRWMGEGRFTVGSLREILRMSSYSVKIAYLPSEEESPQMSPPLRGSDEATMLPKETYKASQEILCRSSQEWDSIKIPVEDNGVLPDQGFRGEVIEWFETASEGDTGPHGWCMIDTFDVRLATILNLPYISLGTYFNPLSEVDDGGMNIVTFPAKSSTSRKKLLDAFLKIDSGEHIHNKCVHVKKVKAVVMAPGQPQKHNTWLTVDGEIVPCEAIYVELHPQTCSVFTAP